ncbi:Homeodomain-like domain-containing protein [Nitrosomonas marina]|uniref:Homeodomain-like domain-containing protein n=1 Tax=Nitrosomonas marina TaxID=917 RepID=A0A1I0GJU6_9PROT|nr:helix-turn-helix domain-containing protein [Nitrosomonas marina]SET71425.1 Homeodomain-like domain-containing protein [Nitrosomonas marina]
MRKRYVVKLTQAEREQLEGLVNKGKVAAYRRKHAQVLLLVDEGKQGPAFFDKDAAERTGFSRRTVEQIRERCVTEGLDSALERKKRCRNRSQKLDGDGEARLVSLACSDAPEGYGHWSLHMLANKLVELDVVDSISHECIRQVLKKHHQTLA